MNEKSGPTRFGEINKHVIGHIMKKTVSHAIAIIRARLLTHEAEEKPGRDGRKDYKTDADVLAQASYVRILTECFPTFGIVGEESDDDGNQLRISCTHPEHDLWFAIDPLDGTRAFMRGESTGVSTMIALVCDGEVIAAYIGDALTGEIYGFRPQGAVYRITEHSGYKRLEPDIARTLKECKVHTGDHIQKYPPAIRKLLGAETFATAHFDLIETQGGSIGVTMAKLWKGHMGAVLLHEGAQAPWDLIPIYGISRALGFVFVGIEPELPLRLAPVDVGITKESYTFERPVLVVHEHYLAEVLAWSE